MPQTPSDVTTRYYVLDTKTDITYGIKLDAEGNCVAVQPMKTVIRNKDGQDSLVFDPLLQSASMPFGQTITAVELNGHQGKHGQAFTMVWPTEEEFAKGARPLVSKKDLPEDFVKAGIAPPPKGGEPGGSVDDAAIAEAIKNIDHMIGLDNAKREIKQNIALARFDANKRELGIVTNPMSRHMVFTGNPGTGKTTFAREVAKAYHAMGFLEKDTVTEVKREDLVAGYVGQTALKTKEMIDKAKGGVLFIDEAYALSRMSGAPGGSNDFGQEAIDTLVAAMENMRDNLIVIVAGYPEPMKQFIDANPGLKSRFMTYIEFEDYSMDQLGEILDTMVADRGYALDADARELAMKKIEQEKNRANDGGAKKDFGNGRTVRNLVEKAEKELATRLDAAGVFNKDHGGLSDAERKAALTTLTLADIEGVTLDSLTTKDAFTPMDFGGSSSVKRAKAVNDDAKPDAKPEAKPAKQSVSARTAFKP